jgi:transcriptional regulator with GAF, ATPase, and Fis domain
VHFADILGKSRLIKEAIERSTMIAEANSTVLITGESGTGKEMIARAIHYHSQRSEHPFVGFDCNTLNEHLLESELFGHIKGAFTGAVANKRGMFEIADNGTLFLDELGDIPLATQAKLLRVIQEREFRGVGSTKTQKINVRLITATNKDLKSLVAAGSFREDLFYRINVFPIHVPALKERREDIPALAFHFLKSFCNELEKPMATISEAAMSTLMNHDWPGNVRELENTIYRAAILTSDSIIRQAHLVSIIDTTPQYDIDVPLTSEDLKRIKKIAREKSVEQVEKLFIQEALRRNDSNVTRSAEETGMQRSNFQALMKKYNIRVRDTEYDADEHELT